MTWNIFSRKTTIETIEFYDAATNTPDFEPTTYRGTATPAVGTEALADWERELLANAELFDQGDYSDDFDLDLGPQFAVRVVQDGDDAGRFTYDSIQEFGEAIIANGEFYSDADTITLVLTKL